jgi:hypothetical protein
MKDSTSRTTYQIVPVYSGIKVAFLPSCMIHAAMSLKGQLRIF